MQYKKLTRDEAYRVELNRIAAESGPVRKFTDEENLYMAEQMNGGLGEFLLAQRKRDVESALELKTIFVG